MDRLVADYWKKGTVFKETYAGKCEIHTGKCKDADKGEDKGMDMGKGTSTGKGVDVETEIIVDAEIDPISLQPIHKSRLFVVMRGQHRRCYDAHVLAKAMLQMGRFRDPVTLLDFTDEELKRIEEVGHDVPATLWFEWRSFCAAEKRLRDAPGLYVRARCVVIESHTSHRKVR